jgi:hypothetical protein
VSKNCAKKKIIAGGTRLNKKLSSLIIISEFVIIKRSEIA